MEVKRPQPKIITSMPLHSRQGRRGNTFPPEYYLTRRMFQQVSGCSAQGAGAEAVPVGYAQDNHFHLAVFGLQNDGRAGMSGLQKLGVDLALFLSRYCFYPG